MIKLTKITGISLLILAVLFMLANMTLIVMSDGWTKLWEVFSPFNVWNNVAVLATVAPGLILIWWADRMQERRAKTSPKMARR